MILVTTTMVAWNIMQQWLLQDMDQRINTNHKEVVSYLEAACHLASVSRLRGYMFVRVCKVFQNAIVNFIWNIHYNVWNKFDQDF